VLSTQWNDRVVHLEKVNEILMIVKVVLARRSVNCVSSYGLQYGEVKMNLALCELLVNIVGIILQCFDTIG